jgi:hypothetical protein
VEVLGPFFVDLAQHLALRVRSGHGMDVVIDCDCGHRGPCTCGDSAISQISEQTRSLRHLGPQGAEGVKQRTTDDQRMQVREVERNEQHDRGQEERRDDQAGDDLAVFRPQHAEGKATSRRHHDLYELGCCGDRVPLLGTLGSTVDDSVGPGTAVFTVDSTGRHIARNGRLDGASHCSERSTRRGVTLLGTVVLTRGDSGIRDAGLDARRSGHHVARNADRSGGAFPVCFETMTVVVRVPGLYGLRPAGRKGRITGR